MFPWMATRALCLCAMALASASAANVRREMPAWQTLPEPPKPAPKLLPFFSAKNVVAVAGSESRAGSESESGSARPCARTCAAFCRSVLPDGAETETRTPFPPSTASKFTCTCAMLNISKSCAATVAEEDGEPTYCCPHVAACPVLSGPGSMCKSKPPRKCPAGTALGYPRNATTGCRACPACRNGQTGAVVATPKCYKAGVGTAAACGARPACPPNALPVVNVSRGENGTAPCCNVYVCQDVPTGSTIKTQTELRLDKRERQSGIQENKHCAKLDCTTSPMPYKCPVNSSLGRPPVGGPLKVGAPNGTKCAACETCVGDATGMAVDVPTCFADRVVCPTKPKCLIGWIAMVGVGEDKGANGEEPCCATFACKIDVLMQIVPMVDACPQRNCSAPPYKCPVFSELGQPTVRRVVVWAVRISLRVFVEGCLLEGELVGLACGWVMVASWGVSLPSSTAAAAAVFGCWGKRSKGDKCRRSVVAIPVAKRGC